MSALSCLHSLIGHEVVRWSIWMMDWETAQDLEELGFFSFHW